MVKRVERDPNQSWTIAPVAPAFNQQPAQGIDDQRWVLTLAGVVSPDFEAEIAGSQWSREQIRFDCDTIAPLTWALDSVSVPVPPKLAPFLLVDQASVFATINSIYNHGQSINSGFAADEFGWTNTGIIDQQGNQNYDIFGGIYVDIGARDRDAVLHRVGYTATLVGRIVIGFYN